MPEVLKLNFKSRTNSVFDPKSKIYQFQMRKKNVERKWERIERWSSTFNISLNISSFIPWKNFKQDSNGVQIKKGFFFFDVNAMMMMRIKINRRWIYYDFLMIAHRPFLLSSISNPNPSSMIIKIIVLDTWWRERKWVELWHFD